MAENEPVLIKAAPSAQTEGATWTLQYKNRFLYSKYNPSKNIIAAIDGLNLLPGTLVLAFSPALFYGFKELEEKCRAADCEILCVEAEPALHAFAQKALKDQELAATLLPLKQNNPRGLDDFFCQAPKKFRRVIRLDLSAGVSFAPDFYKNFFDCAQNIVAAFWKNRLTLVRLGRLYSKNLFKNLIPAAACRSFEAFERTVQKPILVCGAGESLDELTKAAISEPKYAASINKRFFILAVDAAVPALTSSGIKIDAIASTESQLAIEKAFVGIKAQNNDRGPLFLFDLTSRASLARRFDKKSFYFSEFDKNGWTSRLQKLSLLPKIAPPLGSIGLTATYLALLLRKTPVIPVYVLGLDFSFSAGRTHAKGTAQSKALFLSANRLKPANNFSAAFGLASQKALGKNSAPFWAEKNLLGYAALFKEFFEGAQNLYDAGACGIDLGLKRTSLADILTQKDTMKGSAEASDLSLANDFDARARVQHAQAYLREELADLRALADLLSNGEKSEARDKSIALGEQIKAALDCKEYLYLHFPDGTEASMDTSFLTRVRSQIDFFAKDIETALCGKEL